MRKIYDYFILLAFMGSMLSFSSCRKACEGKNPIVGVINHCTFDMAIEVDIIGGAKHLDTLSYMESLYYNVNETKVNLKFTEAAPLITLSRTKNVEAKNCWQYDYTILENDSGILYDFDVNRERTWHR